MGDSSLSLLFCPHMYRVTAAVSASVPASNLDAALCVLRTASLQLLLLLQMLLFNSTKLDKV